MIGAVSRRPMFADHDHEASRGIRRSGFDIAREALPGGAILIIAAGNTAVGLTVEGDLSIGAFNVVGPFVEDNDQTMDVDEAAMSMACPAAAADPVEGPEMYLMSNLLNEDGDPATGDMGSAMQAAGMYGLCVNVDVAGTLTNTSPIPSGDYMGTLSDLSHNKTSQSRLS